MDITFIRGEKGAYSATVQREDGLLLQVSGSDRTFPLPHDLAHYLVEHGLGLKHGFWGRIAEGAIYPGMKILSGRQRPHAADRSRQVIREAAQQGVEAEVLVGVFLKIVQEGLESDLVAVRALLADEWRPGRPERSLPNAEEVERICTALREAEQQWQALEVGQTMAVHWLAHKNRRK